ncbi:MFS general substrate transporter, partial [Cristinia sonorae]
MGATDIEKQSPQGDKGLDRDGDGEETSVTVTQSTVEWDPRCKVSLDPAEDPKHIATWRKWVIVFVIATSALCVTCASSVAAFTENAVSETFHVGKEVPILSISLFVLGLGIGPLLVGPLSEVYGRNLVYRVAIFAFWAFTWPVAFPPDIATFLIFRFITGFCGAAFLVVAGGSVGDLFEGPRVAAPMAWFTLSPFIGPTLGPLISGFINQNTNWKWTYRLFLIWIFAQWAAVVLLVPETYHPALLKWKAAKLRKTTGDNKYWAPLDQRKETMMYKIAMSCYVPFKHLAVDQMALLLDLWSAILLGILYLAFQAFPIIFGQVHGFNTQEVGLSFLGIGLGMLLAVCMQLLWNRCVSFYAGKVDGQPRTPEQSLIAAQLGGILVPLSLFWLAFTTYPRVHWIVPIVASIPFGMGVLLCFTSIFTYLVTAYRPIAASAMAANTFVRATFAAAFPLFARQMYNRLGTVGATALLAGLTSITAPLPFIFYRIGARLRAKSSTSVA